MLARVTDLDRSTVARIVHAIGDRLGRWLVVGGAAMALWLAPRRITEDIDVVPITQTGRERLELMELAEQLGVPIESVNSAADFFVRRIEGWQDELELLYQGVSSTVYRPNATLMLLLKMRRLSELDLGDCELVLGTALPVDRERVRAALGALPPTDDAALAARREKLRALVGAG
jgi:hypothetical protein